MTGHKHERRVDGFTIIELLIASLVFSIVLVTVMAAFIQISRIFYKGVNMSNTEDDTQTAMIDIANDIKYTSSTLPDVPDPSHPSQNWFCIGGHRYSYFFGTQVSPGASAGIYRENVSSTNCPPLSGLGAVGVNTASADQLLGAGMQLNSLSIDCSNGITCVLQAHVVFYGGSPDGLFSSPSNQDPQTPWEAPDAQCTGSLTSSQYCAAVDYESTVLQSP